LPSLHEITDTQSTQQENAMRYFGFCLLIVFLIGGHIIAQEKTAVPEPRTPALDGPSPGGHNASQEELVLIQQLQRARREGNTVLAMSTHAAIMARRGIRETREVPPYGGMPEEVRLMPPFEGSDWGTDIWIRGGNLEYLTQRMLATQTGPDGSIYAAGAFLSSAPTTGGTDTLWIYKSTDNGFAWSRIGGATLLGNRIESISMHVTDTVGGAIVGMLATFTLPASRYDGNLWWISWRENGSNFRATLVKSRGTLGYMHPTLVSDGFRYSASGTWWYGAAAMADSNGVSSGLLGVRSTNFGTSWITDTIRTSWDDFWPTIEYNDAGANESVYVAAQVSFSPRNSDVRLF
jgi:hypothetical protein